jgi:hypothetical protein
MFRAVSPPIIRSSKLYTQHLVYVKRELCRENYVITQKDNGQDDSQFRAQIFISLFTTFPYGRHRLFDLPGKVSRLSCGIKWPEPQTSHLYMWFSLIPHRKCPSYVSIRPRLLPCTHLAIQYSKSVTPQSVLYDLRYSQRYKPKE